MGWRSTCPTSCVPVDIGIPPFSKKGVDLVAPTSCSCTTQLSNDICLWRNPLAPRSPASTCETLMLQGQYLWRTAILRATCWALNSKKAANQQPTSKRTSLAYYLVSFVSWTAGLMMGSRVPRAGYNPTLKNQGFLPWYLTAPFVNKDSSPVLSHTGIAYPIVWRLSILVMDTLIHVR